MNENKAKTLATAAIIQTAMNDLPNIIQMAKFQAKMYKINYDAAIEAGFTKDQAIQLCKTK